MILTTFDLQYNKSKKGLPKSLDTSNGVSSHLVCWFRIKKFKINFHLGFLIRIVLAILINKSPRYFLQSLDLIGLSVQEKQFEINF